MSETTGKKPWLSALPYFVGGDIDGFAAVFSNNLATMLAGCAMLTGPGVLPEDIVYGKIVPGVGISMAFGCVWYVLLTLKTASNLGRTDMCAIPFGINTPGVFAFNAGAQIPSWYWVVNGWSLIDALKTRQLTNTTRSIIYNVFYSNVGTMGAEEAGKLAWQVGCVCNCLQGLIEVVLAPIGPYISEFVPMVALLGSLASVGIAWLFTGTLQEEVAWPIVTFAPFFLIITALFAGVALPKIPSTLVPIIIGGATAWITGKATMENVNAAKSTLGFYPAIPELSPYAPETMDLVLPYVGIAIPVALTVAIGTIQVRQMAENAGDNYPLRLSMVGDGLATVLASLFGSPWGMTVFIGHGAFKQMGACIGYSIMCGIAFVLVCFSGASALFLAVFPAQVLNPIILFVGLAVVNDALDVTPAKHWPALMVSLVPGMFNWCITQVEGFAGNICMEEGAVCPSDPFSGVPWDKSEGLLGIYSMGNGYLLTSIYWASIMIYILDHKFHLACLWSLIAALSASFGLIHSATVFVPEFLGGSGYIPGRISMYMEFTYAYLLNAAIMLIIYLVFPKTTVTDMDEVEVPKAGGIAGSRASRMTEQNSDRPSTAFPNKK